MSTFSPAGQDAGETGQCSPERIQGALPLVSVCSLSHHRIWGIQVVKREFFLGKWLGYFGENKEFHQRRTRYARKETFWEVSKGPRKGVTPVKSQTAGRTSGHCNNKIILKEWVMEISKNAYLWGLFKEFSLFVLGGGVGRRVRFICSVSADNQIIHGTQKDTHWKCPVANTQSADHFLPMLLVKGHIKIESCWWHLPQKPVMGTQK